MSALGSSRPAHKGLCYPLARAPAAEELGQPRRSKPVGRDRCEKGEHGLVFAQVDVRHLLEETNVPTGGGAVVLLRPFVSEEKRQLEGLDKADELELRRGRKRLGDVASAQGSAKAHVGRA